MSALIGAIGWNLITWWLGLPASSTHALIGGLMGAGVAGQVTVHWDSHPRQGRHPDAPLPVVGFSLAFALMVGVLWLVRNSAPARTMRRFRLAQTASAAAMALGHGLQDAQKTMGVIMLALVAGGFYDQGDAIPLWVDHGHGHLAGHLLRRVAHHAHPRPQDHQGLDPARGFVAESVAASVLYTSAYWLHAPISTTHTITSAIMGVGATKRLSAVRWGVAKNIGFAWVLTIPMAALVAACVYWILNPILT